MSYAWNSCPTSVRDVVYLILERTKEIVNNEGFIGYYIHGSLAMGDLIEFGKLLCNPYLKNCQNW